MVVTNFGLSGNALLWAGSGLIPQFLAIGSGSGANVATLGSLVAEVFATRAVFTTRDITVARSTKWIFDKNSVTMSGLQLTEFGIAGSQAKGTNDLWLREGFSQITFDGTNEAQFQITFTSF